MTSETSRFAFVSTSGSSTTSRVHCVPSICEEINASFLTYININKSAFEINCDAVSSFTSCLLASTKSLTISSSILIFGIGGNGFGLKD